MVKEDTEDVSVPKAIQPPEVVCQIDVAEAVGLMTQKTSTCDVYPSWCTSDFCETIRTSQVCAAVFSHRSSLIACCLAESGVSCLGFYLNPQTTEC